MTIIIHNVSDRRIGWIGPWEAEPLSTILTPEHVGRTVIYRDHGRADHGVFARYSRGDTAAGARISDLWLGLRALPTTSIGGK